MRLLKRRNTVISFFFFDEFYLFSQINNVKLNRRERIITSQKDKMIARKRMKK
jgi:hypothetical protein